MSDGEDLYQFGYQALRGEQAAANSRFRPCLAIHGITMYSKSTLKAKLCQAILDKNIGKEGLSKRKQEAGPERHTALMQMPSAAYNSSLDL